MRNLKRALSLTLASVMLLGMMVVGAGAASYPDVSESDNVEAIEVLQAVKVMVGDEKGNFGPDQPVNRAQMAVVMALLLDLDYDYYEGTNPFKDVPAWAAPYVAACYANGIVSGYDAYTYGSGDPVTAVQAASMMMRALGYFKYPSDYSNNGGFELATVKQASKIELFRQINANAKDPLTRNQVAQLALNALKTPIVEAEDKTFNLVDGNGNLVVTGGQVNYVVTASSQAFARAIDDTESYGNALNGVSGYIIELGEKLYNGKLKLDNDATDPFDRPARKWEFDGKGIGTYAKKELLEKEYVGKVTGKDLYDLLGATTIKDYDLNVAIDGVNTAGIVGTDSANLNHDYVFTDVDMNKNNKAGVGNTGVGTLTQVYVDHEKDKVSIAIINTYLAIASKNYDEKKDETSVYAYSMKRVGDEYVKVNKNGTSAATVTLNPAGEDFALVKDLQKDDAVLITVAEGEIQTIALAEVLESVSISAFKKKDNITVDGTKYTYTTTAGYRDGDLDVYTGNDGKENLKDRTYNVYLDTYGNLIGLKEVEAKKNYVFITGVDLGNSLLTNKTAEMNAIFLDGTMDTIKVNMTKSTLTTKNGNKNAILNTWCTYTKSGDVYTLRQVANVGYGDRDPETSEFNQGNVTAANIPNSTNKNKLAQIQVIYPTAGYNNGKDIDKKHISLPGGAHRTGDAFYNVYGDENTVYLTAKLGELTTSAGNYGVIKDVAGRTVGVDNASITVWNSAKALQKANDSKVTGAPTAGTISEGAYVLYDNDGIIIASVIVGEDAGASKNLVYVHSSGLEEEVDAKTEDGKAATGEDWIWYRKAIQDGEEVTLKEVGSESSYLEDMVQYQWYEIKLNGDNEVIEAVDAATSMENSSRTDFVGDHKQVGITIEKDAIDTVLYYTDKGAEDGGLHGEMKLTGRTLYVDTKNPSGFQVDADVKAVLHQWSKNTNQTEVIVENGLDGLQQIINWVNEYKDARTTNPYYVSAIVEKGGATVVVVRDTYNPYTTDDDSKDPTVPGGVEKAPNTKIADVNKLLADGKDVVIRSTWTPSDADGSNALVIPAGRTFSVKGDFNATNVNSYKVPISADSSTTSKLIVTGTLTIDGTTLADVDFPVVAKKIVVKGSDPVSFSKDISMTELEVKDSVLTIEKGVKVTVKDITGDRGGTIDVYGTLYINGTEAEVTLNVYRVSSVYAPNAVVYKVVVGDDSDEDNNGYFEGKVLQFVNQNVNQKKAPKVEVSTGRGSSFVVSAGTETIITGDFDPKTVTIEDGATVTFDSKGEATGTAAGLFKAANGASNAPTAGNSFTANGSNATISGGTVSNPITGTANVKKYTMTMRAVAGKAGEDGWEAPYLEVNVTKAAGVKAGANDKLSFAAKNTEITAEAIGLSTAFGEVTDEKTVTYKVYFTAEPEENATAEAVPVVTYLGLGEIPASNTYTATIMTSEEEGAKPEDTATVTFKYDVAAKAAAIVKAVRARVTAEGVDIGKITVSGNTITATGDLYYAGKPMEGDGSSDAYNRSVARELSTFLWKMHDWDSSLETIKYNSTTYTWSDNESEAKNPYVSNGTSIIKAVVGACEEKNLATNGGQVTITLSVDDFEIIFKAVITK